MPSFEHVEHLPLAEIQVIDSVCRRFEARWGGPDSPRIEDYLTQVSEATRTPLLRELIAVEVELHTSRGTAAPLADLQRRFPDQSEWIVTLAEEVSAGRPPLARPQHPPPFPAGHRIGPYTLVREVGRGGMGVVYEAIHAALCRRVAVKVLPPSLFPHPQSLRRFVREARIVCQLDHPHIVTVYEVGTDGDVPYFAMPFVPGRNLAQVLRDAAGRPLPLPEVVGLMAIVAEALHHAHGRGVVHRDVKPSNLLLDEKGKVWVTDFGLARSAVDGSDLTARGDVIGTLRYMPPEAFRGQWDAAGDVYGLGATLYELLVGRPAFPGDNAYQLMESICFRTPTPVRLLRPDVPAGLEAVVERAMHRDPRRRHASAGELARALRAADGVTRPRRDDGPTRRAALLGALGLGGLTLWAGTAAPPPRPAPRTPEPRADDLPGLVPCPGRLADGRRWQMVSVLARDHLYAVAWNPEGTELATGDEAGWIRLLRVEGRALRLSRVFLGHRSTVFALAWGRSGRLASASGEGTIRIWEPDGRTVTTLKGHRHSVRSLAWSPDGRSLVSGGSDGTVRVWDTVTGQGQTLHHDSSAAIAHVGWSADGRYLAAAAGQVAHMWRVGDLPHRRFNNGHLIQALAWSPHGHELATSSRDGRVRLWRPAREGPWAVLDVPAIYLSWHPDGDRFVTVSEHHRREIHQWGRDGTRRGRPIVSPHGPIHCLSWNPNGKSLGIGCVGGGVAVWREGEIVSLPPLAPAHHGPSVSWNANGELLTAGPLAIWSADGTRAVRVPQAGPADLASWGTHDRPIVARKGHERGVVILTRDGHVLQQVPAASHGVLSPDGRLALLSADRHEYQVWNRDGSPGPRTPSGTRGDSTSGLAWDTTGKQLAITALGVLYLWQPGGGGLRLIAEEGTEGFGSPVWSPDGRWVAALNRQRILLHRSDGTPHRRWEAHASPVQRLAWSPDSRWLASVGEDRTLRLWTLTGAAGPSLALPQFYAQAIAWAADGRIALASPNHTLYVVRLRARKLEPQWIGILTKAGAVAFDAAGRPLQGNDRLVDEQFACVIEGESGELHLMPPSRVKR